MAKTRKTTVEPEEVAVPDKVTRSIEKKAMTVTDMASSLTINDARDYESAGRFLTETIKSALAQLDDAFDSIIRHWHEGHKMTIAQKKKLAQPFLDAEKTVKRLMADYAMRERRRQEEEAQRLIRAQQEAAEEEAVARALEAQEAGDDEEAEAILAQLEGGEIRPAMTAPPVVHRAPKAEGVSVRTSWGYRIVDAGKIDKRFLIPDEKAIKNLVKSMGPRAEAAIGAGSIEVYETANIGASSGGRR